MPRNGCAVTVRVIVGLEVIHIDENHGQIALIALRTFNFSFELILLERCSSTRNGPDRERNRH